MAIVAKELATVKLGLQGVRTHITAQKAAISLDAMDRLAAEGRWPNTPEEVTGYLGRTASTRRFKNIMQMLNYTKQNPKMWLRPLRFEPNNVGVLEDLVRASNIAMRECYMKTQKGMHIDTGDYMASFKRVISVTESQPWRPFTGANELKINRSSTVMIYNDQPYASSLEAHVFRRMRANGIMHHAAQVVAKKYPQLVVQFSYSSNAGLGDGLATSHNYAVPYIKISFRGGGLKAKIRKPGRNIMRRRSAYRRMGPADGSLGDYHRLHSTYRRARGLKRIDGRHYGDDLYSYYSRNRKR